MSKTTKTKRPAKPRPAPTKARKPKTGTRGGKAIAGADTPQAELRAAEAKRPPVMTEEEAKARNLSLVDAAIEVMKQLKQPRGAKDITISVMGLGLWRTKGKTPEATLYSAMIREIANKGEQARFKKVSRGLFELTAAAYGD